MTRPLASRILLWCLVAGGGLVGMTQAVAQLGTRLSVSDIRAELAQNTLSYTTIGGGAAKAYLAADGALRGTYEDKKFNGSWTIRDDMICLDFPEQDDDGCWSIFRLPDGQLQLFTKTGTPAGYIGTTKGNPDKF